MPNPEGVAQGQLFSADFIGESIAETDDWKTVTDADLETFEAAVSHIFENFPVNQSPNEAQTEEDLIWEILKLLGWKDYLRGQNLSAHGRDDVPDGLLFADEEAKDRANKCQKDVQRYELGLALVESKRWSLPLDRRSEKEAGTAAPSTQMLRYLRRVDDLTEGNLRWGILTNGAKWRLYWSGARSVSEQFLEIDLAAVMDIPGHNEGLFRAEAEDRPHWLKLFLLFFRREAFISGGPGQSAFHQRVMEEGRLYEDRVAGDLSNLVFDDVFPRLARAVAAKAPDADLQDVREAALIVLYRLLFIFYAEDRNLLPAREERYGKYSLRNRVREDVRNRKKVGEIFAKESSQYWRAMTDICEIIDSGANSIGLPPYNGGLFDSESAPLLAEVQVSDHDMSEIIEALSYTKNEKHYINYRDLSVQQLGSIYERLLEYGLVREGGEVDVKLNIYARKRSGSYYTPDNLVGLILRETVGPLVDTRIKAFEAEAGKLEKSKGPKGQKIARLQEIDPASALLDLKICDPAMGSGHFLVSLVDMLSDNVLNAMAEAEALFDDYFSPLSARIEGIRARILKNAEENSWTVNIAQLDDRHIVRRMVLKRCVYGVDKNPMAVELAKVALWLHTFTVGAPLGFLDHHLRCGDSLFGCWVRSGLDAAEKHGSPLLLHETRVKAAGAARSMQKIEEQVDADISEAHDSANTFNDVRERTKPLNAFLALTHALDWLNLRGAGDKSTLHVFYDGQLGDPIEIAMGAASVKNKHPEAKRFSEILAQARELIREENFFNWQVMFPGVWDTWESKALHGGFDAVIGNPPWDRVKLDQRKWFKIHRPEITKAPTKAARKRMIEDLEKSGDTLFDDYTKASNRAEAAFSIARRCGDYPLLSKGDMNIYALFVERAAKLCKPEGMVGLLTPIGVATDKTASKFFSNLADEKKLKAFYGFENKGHWLFKIHAEDQPSVIVFSNSRHKFAKFDFCVRISTWEQFMDPEQRFPISSRDLKLINPNTKTAPMFRSRRDAKLMSAIYGRLPLLVKRAKGGAVNVWPIKYRRMFDMTEDSHLFRTREEMETQEGGYPIEGNKYGSANGEWLPLYEGKTIQIYNHRHAHVRINPKNVSGQGISEHIPKDKLADPSTTPEPRFWVNAGEVDMSGPNWRLCFNDVCNTNNQRSVIAAMVPLSSYGNKLPLLQHGDNDSLIMPLLLANFCSIVYDYTARQKIQSRNLNKYILEQIPVVPPEQYDSKKFGRKTAGDIVREAVLELTYTAHNMAPFAQDMGYVDKKGKVKPPFAWDEERRLNLRAKLDALYFHLYGVTKRDDVEYIYSTFDKVETAEKKTYGRYLSRDLCLAWINALAAGKPDAKIQL